MLGPQLEGLVRERGSVRLLRIDVPSWEAPTAVEFGLRKLPTLWLYSGRVRVADDTLEILELLRAE